MNKSILVLDENSVIHGLVTSALETEGLTLHHEFNPGRYVERANSLMPDLILVGNSERDPDYEICRSLKASGQLSEVPLVLLASSKQSLSSDLLERLRVAGVVRKPFEASDLQQQVSKHLNLVDLIGSAYEYRQSQSTADEGSNPLANLDVLDDEVLGLLRGTAPAQAAPTAVAATQAAPAQPEPQAAVGGAPIVDDEVLAEALQPERAFEAIDEAEPQGPTGPRYDSLETLEGEFPSETLEIPESEDELDELGAADVLEEESPEEAVFEPQGFDQELEAEHGGPAEPSLDDIEVELPEDTLDTGALTSELDEGEVDLFESDLVDEGEGVTHTEYEESIPLSVLRMMELKPVFTMTQEETAEEEVLEPFDFEPDATEVQAIQSELDDLEAVDLAAEPHAEAEAEEAAEVREQELEFASEQDLQSIGTAEEEALEPPEDFNLMGESEPEPEPLVEATPEPAPEPVVEAEPEPVLEEETLEADELEGAEIGEDWGEEELDAESLRAGEPVAGPADAAPRAEEPVAAVSPLDEGEEDDYFIEEYLGDEEIDEEQIIAAEEEEDEEDIEAPELSEEDEADLDELLASEEHLDDLDDLDEVEADTLVAEDAEGLDEDIELDTEEEELILSSLDTEHQEHRAAAEEPLFERNFNALEEEGAAASASDETWQLEQEDGGFAMVDEELPGEEVIDLEEPEAEPTGAEEAELEAMEEVPASALEEIEEVEAIELPPEAAPVATASAAEELAALEEEEPVSIEFGEGGADVFAGEAQEETWKPKAPPSFVAQPAEDFPEDAVREPFVGPHGQPEKPEPPVVPRHTRDEVLEDPDTLAPTLSEQEEAPAAEAAEAEADLADSVQPYELEGEEAEETEDELGAHPSLSVLADDALGSVAAPAEEWDADLDLGDLQAEEMADEDMMDETLLDVELGEEPGAGAQETDERMEAAFEPVSLEEPAALGAEAEGLAGGEELEFMLGAGHATAGEAGAASDDPEFDNLFASLREEIAANPEGERIDDVLRSERIRDGVAALDFSLPQHENTFARAMGVYELLDDGEGPSAYPAALQGSGVAAPQRVATEPAAADVTMAGPAAATLAGAGISASDVDVLSLLDPDIRAKLGQVLDEIISISVRKAVQEEMPKIMERLSKEA